MLYDVNFFSSWGHILQDLVSPNKNLKIANNISKVPVSTVQVNSIGLKGNAIKAKVEEGVYSSAIHTDNFLHMDIS